MGVMVGESMLAYFKTDLYRARISWRGRETELYSLSRLCWCCSCVRQRRNFQERLPVTDQIRFRGNSHRRSSSWYSKEACTDKENDWIYESKRRTAPGTFGGFGGPSNRASLRPKRASPRPTQEVRHDQRPSGCRHPHQIDSLEGEVESSGSGTSGTSGYPDRPVVWYNKFPVLSSGTL